MGTHALSSRVLLAACILVLTGCASGYKEYFRPAGGSSPEVIARLRVAPPGEPLVERVSAVGDSKTFQAAYYRRGYVMIGSSMFNHGRPQRDEDGIAQGKDIGADLVVLVAPRLTGTSTSVVPITTPTTSTAYSTGNATAFGPRGPVTAFGSSTTTVYGSTTNYVPVTVNRVDYGAVYFIKRKFSFGAFYRDLEDRERKELQTNRGAAIDIIVNQSPAFYADVLEGDIITAVDDESVLDQQGFTNQLTARHGRKVVLSIYRAGQRLEKPVQLSP